MGGIPASGVFEANVAVDHQVVTDAKGKAEAVVILSRQPGNNFKVAGVFEEGCEMVCTSKRGVKKRH